MEIGRGWRLFLVVGGYADMKYVVNGDANADVNLNPDGGAWTNEEKGCMKFALMKRPEDVEDVDRKKLEWILPEYFG